MSARATCLSVALLLDLYVDGRAVAAPLFESIVSGGHQSVAVTVLPTTQALLRHRHGDAVASLEMINPPSGVVSSLGDQSGALLERVEREIRVGNKLNLLLRLRSKHIVVRMSQADGPRLIFSFTHEGPPAPHPSLLLGRIEGLYRLDSLTPVFPDRAPSENPCPALPEVGSLIKTVDSGHMLPAEDAQAALAHATEKACRAFIASLIAESLSKGGELDSQVERWAYEMRMADPWPSFPRSFDRARLVAVEILIARDLLPEAEALLIELGRSEDASLAPFLSLSWIKRYIEDRRFGDARGVARKVFEKPIPASANNGRFLYALHSARAIAAMRAGEFSEARAFVQQAIATLRPFGSPNGGGALWVAGAEAALRLGDRQTSAKFFHRATEFQGDPERAFALMRLGDLALAAGTDSSTTAERVTATEKNPALLSRLTRAARSLRPSDPQASIARAQELYRQALDIHPPAGSRELLELRGLVLARNAPNEDALLQQFMSTATSTAARVESAYALSRLRLFRGDADGALEILGKAETFDLDHASSHTLDALKTEILDETVYRYVRHRDWLGLAQRYIDQLAKDQNLLSAQAMQRIAESYYHVGVFEGAREMLFGLLQGVSIEESLSPAPPRTPDVEATTLGTLHESVVLTLARSYFGARDFFRTEVVTQYFFSRYPRSPHLWEARLLWAETLLALDRPSDCLAHLDAVRSEMPAGDPSEKAALFRTTALSMLGRHDESAVALVAILGSEGLLWEDVHKVGVEVLSNCASHCEPATLRKVLDRAAAYEDGRLISDQIRFLSALRGMSLPEPRRGETRDARSSVWQELLHLAPELSATAAKGRSDNGGTL